MSVSFALGAHQKRHCQSFLVALGIEVTLVLSLLVWMSRDAPIQQAAIPLSLDVVVDAPFEKNVPLEKPKKRSEIEPPQAKPVTLPKQEATTTSLPQPTTAESHATSSVSKETPATPSLAAPSAVPMVDPSLAYNIKLAAAVQAAFEVPGSAKALGFKGKARVEFNMRNGVASGVRVIQSSGLAAVDRAAVVAVQAASFPPPPTALLNKEGIYQIWVACF